MPVFEKRFHGERSWRTWDGDGDGSQRVQDGRGMMVTRASYPINYGLGTVERGREGERAVRQADGR